MDQEILNTILKDTYSMAVLKHRLRLLKSNLLKTFFGKSAEDTPASPADLNWLNSLPNEFYQKFNKDNVYQIFSEIEKTMTKFATLTIYLTFEPDAVSLGQIGTYCRQSFNLPFLMLDTKLDPTLIAGTAIVWKGVLKDYSLRAKIENRKAEIAEGFKRFLHRGI